MEMIRFNILTIFILLSSITMGQDVEFSQFYSSATYLNPSLAGLREDNVFAMTYRNQWPAIKNAYESAYVSYERSLRGHNAGLGVFFINDVAGEGTLKRQQLALVYSKQVRFSHKLYGSFGLKGTYNVSSINWDALTWGDMIDLRKGVVYNTMQPMKRNSMSYVDAGAGAVLYTDEFFGGVSIEHLLRPDYGMLSLYNSTRIPLRYKVHLGGNIPINDAPNSINFTIAPQLIYTRQEKSSQLVVGGYAILNKISMGLWHRLKDSYIISLGTEIDKFRCSYSFDLGANKLIAHSGGAHEVSITFLFEHYRKEKKKKHKLMSCPKF